MENPSFLLWFEVLSVQEQWGAPLRLQVFSLIKHYSSVIHSDLCMHLKLQRKNNRVKSAAVIACRNEILQILEPKAHQKYTKTFPIREIVLFFISKTSFFFLFLELHVLFENYDLIYVLYYTRCLMKSAKHSANGRRRTSGHDFIHQPTVKNVA